MKRTWFAAALLLLLLGVGIYITVSASDIHAQIADTLSLSADAAAAGDWDAAAAHSAAARSVWEQHRNSTAAITDHEPMEEIDSLFSQLQVYLSAEQQAAFCACCRCLEVMVGAIGEAQSVNWWNLL